MKTTQQPDPNDEANSEEDVGDEGSCKESSKDSDDEDSSNSNSAEGCADDDDDDDGDDDDDDDDSNDDDNDEEDKGDENDEENWLENSKAYRMDIRRPPVSANGEPCTFDLRNLLAMNSHQIDDKALYARGPDSIQKEEKASIPLPEGMEFAVVDEEYLLHKAVDGCAQLIDALWQLPKEKTDVGAMVRLPLHDDSRVPRALVSWSV